MRTLLTCFALLLCFAAAPSPVRQPPVRHRAVLMISMDGLRPDSVTHADEHALRIPTLRSFVAHGSYAEGVRGVFPTVTYPSHTTLVTGVWPAEHGIYNNEIFDPQQQYASQWYWYADSVRVGTLWQAAHAAGLRTASVSWPVTVDSAAIDDNIPEYWRGATAPTGENEQDRYMMNAVSRPAGALAEMQQRLGPYMRGNDTSLAGDQTRTAFAVDILRRLKPQFMTVHLSSLDAQEHAHGPFSAEANSNLEALDPMVGQLVEAAMAANPRTVVLLVSDHGFASIHDDVNLAIPFVEAGLITLTPGQPGAAPRVQSWVAEPWMAGGMAAIVLSNPADGAVQDQVRKLLDRLAADPANGIDRVLTGEEAHAAGAFPNASFLVTLRVGFHTGGALSGPMLTPQPGRGSHGYPPTDPEMFSSFFALGQGIAEHRSLGMVDMRQIAPTAAQLLGVTLAAATQKPLPLMQ